MAVLGPNELKELDARHLNQVCGPAAETSAGLSVATRAMLLPSQRHGLLASCSAILTDLPYV